MPEAWFNRAVARHALGDLDGALADCDRALQLRPNYASARNERGAIRRDLDDVAGALADFDEALRLDPTLAAAYNNRAVVLKGLGDFPAALADYDAVLRLRPDDAAALSNRAALRRGNGRSARRRCRLRTGAASDAAQRERSRPPCALLLRRKDWPAAIAAFDRALQIDPRLYWAHVLRGNARYHNGDWQASCDDYRNAFALNPSRSAGLFVRDLQSALRTNRDAALRSAEEHVRQDPVSPIGRCHRGLVRFLAGDEARAEADFAAGLALCPEATPFLELVRRHAHRAVKGRRTSAAAQEELRLTP